VQPACQTRLVIAGPQGRLFRTGSYVPGFGGLPPARPLTVICVTVTFICVNCISPVLRIVWQET